MSSGRSEFPGVIQAAGLSRRMGSSGPKLLLPLRGRPLVAHVAEAALASRLSEVVVVIGPEPERFRTALPRDGRLRIVVNARPEEGRSGSIRAGLAAVGADAPGVLFLLGDQPLMTPATIDAVIAAAEVEETREAGGAPLVVAVVRDDGGVERKGNPVLFRRALFGALERLSGDRGALAVIEAHWNAAARVPVADPATQERVETPEDYERLLSRRGAGFA